MRAARYLCYNAIMTYQKPQKKTPEAGIIGLTITGIAWGAALAEKNIVTLASDTDDDLAEGVAEELSFPGHEPKLEAAVKQQVAAGTLQFSENTRRVITTCPVIFLTGMTPPDEAGIPSTRFLLSAVRQIANQSPQDRTVVVKASVSPGATAQLQREADETTAARQRKNGSAPNITLAVMPELFNDGRMLTAMRGKAPVVVGTDKKLPRAFTTLLDRIDPDENHRVMTDTVTAELSVFSDAGLVAIEEVYINTLAKIAADQGADARKLFTIMKKGSTTRRQVTDDRGTSAGAGGRRLMAETAELVRLAEKAGIKKPLIAQAISENTAHTKAVIKWLTAVIAMYPHDVIAFLGASPSPGTDDLRDAPAIDVLKALSAKYENDPPAGNAVKPFRLFVPYGADQVKWRLFRTRAAFDFADSAADATRGADILITLARYPGASRVLNEALTKRMRGRAIVDMAGVFDREKAEAFGFDYRTLFE